MSKTLWLGLWSVLVIGACVTCLQAAAQPPGGNVQGDSAIASGDRETLGPLPRFFSDLFHVSAKEVREKGMRVIVVCTIALIAKISMDVVKWVSRLLVNGEWGPLKYIFRNRQRSATLHGLVISLLKYVVYFTAMGYILNELGVKYTTFLASVSLIGIAIGFGAQGLVQDVVTGFFILFESQFAIGDMVEISGQVGIVEEIGLRTTRLRNYFGAQLIFQNRNIPMAGRYRKGAFEVCLDVAIPSQEVAEKAAGILQQIGEEMERQFREVIMEPPKVLGLVELGTRELFVRMQARIWPLQQWVIDAQMIPRIREIFSREGIEIPGDRVVAFYHFPDDQKEDLGVVHAIQTIVRHVAGRPDRSDGQS